MASAVERVPELAGAVDVEGDKEAVARFGRFKRQPRLALRAASAAQRDFTVTVPEPAEQARTDRV